MIEYIVEKKQTSGGWTWAEPKGKLIRCKDCKYREYGYCNLYLSFHRLTADMDYCSDAERKEE